MKNIFISSTFIDMQAERDLVQERVVPALRTEARKYGDNVGVIDLRWGVDTSTLETEKGAAKVLQVCLDEIDRSHPYMLIFLGERYGTMMPEKQIAESICGREDKYTTDDYLKSITALEVEYGALSEKYGDLEHCIVCFREPVVHMLNEDEKVLYAEHTEEGERKLAALKERIKHKLRDNPRLITYSCTWDESARQLVDFRSDGQPLDLVLANCFIEMFREDWKEYDNLSWQDKEQLSFRALMESKLRSFVGREELLRESYQKITNASCPIILQGETGSGKTAIMCKLAEQLQRNGNAVFPFFAGAGSMSANAESLVKQMVYNLEKLLGMEEHFAKEEVGYNEWNDYLADLCFRLPAEQKVFLLIDALDQLYPDEHVEKLDFFVKGKNIQIVASCTDTFELPMDVLVNREVQLIPALNKEDAVAVAEGILASYSRNAYKTIEDEILKKKSIGSPLYISLLIQRLNMMDTEELRKAMTEEEIIAQGTGIIRKMPDDLEEAIVSVIWNGIDKISENKTSLIEVLELLAVSGNGLRMQDLQGIFAAQKKKFAALDVTLLMKYLDTFFYVHEDDRIDFTHKVIRHGLLKRLPDREIREKVILEYLKSLDEMDGLRLREGMRFAGICMDKEFAKELICQAYEHKLNELIRAIKNEAVEDGGEFYCALIAEETEDKSIVCEFLFELLDKFGLSKEEKRAELAIENALILCKEKLYDKLKSEESLKNLSSCYDSIGKTLRLMGRLTEAKSYFEKMLCCSESLHEKWESEKNLNELAISCNNMGDILSDLGQVNEALPYYERMIKYDENLYHMSGSDESLRTLSIGYISMGHALRNLRRLQESLSYFDKAIMHIERLYEESKTDARRRELSYAYASKGHTLRGLGRLEDACTFFERALRHDEILQKKEKSDRSLRDLSISYDNMGKVLRNLGKTEEAYFYYEKALKCAESLYEKSGSDRSLEELKISYDSIGNVLLDLGRVTEAIDYYKKALRYADILSKKLPSDTSLRGLSISYVYMGDALKKLNRLEEALSYYEKASKIHTGLYKNTKSDGILNELSVSYNDVGDTLIELGRMREALVYYEKVIKCNESLYETLGTKGLLQQLASLYMKMGHFWRNLGQAKDALHYHERGIFYAEKWYEKSGSEKSKQELSYAYLSMGNVLIELGRMEEGGTYYEKAMKYNESLISAAGADVLSSPGKSVKTRSSVQKKKESDFAVKDMLVLHEMDLKRVLKDNNKDI